MERVSFVAGLMSYPLCGQDTNASLNVLTDFLDMGTNDTRRVFPQCESAYAVLNHFSA